MSENDEMELSDELLLSTGEGVVLENGESHRATFSHSGNLRIDIIHGRDIRKSVVVKDAQATIEDFDFSDIENVNKSTQINPYIYYAIFGVITALLFYIVIQM